MDDIIFALKVVGGIIAIGLLTPLAILLWGRYFEWLDKKFNGKWWP